MHEENITQFVGKSKEIQDLLQSKEAPLELQVNSKPESAVNVKSLVWNILGVY